MAATHQRMIELLEAYLELARAGKLQAFVSIAVDGDGDLLVAKHGRIDPFTWRQLSEALYAKLFGPKAKPDLRLIPLR